MTVGLLSFNYTITDQRGKLLICAMVTIMTRINSMKLKVIHSKVAFYVLTFLVRISSVGGSVSRWATKKMKRTTLSRWTRNKSLRSNEDLASSVNSTATDRKRFV